MKVHINYVIVDNGRSLVVKSGGFSKFRSKLMFNYMLNLNNLLNVPRITKNIIWVSKYAKDNNVYLESYFDKYYVKSHTSNVMLLEGFLDDNDCIALKSSFRIFKKAHMQQVSKCELCCK